MGNTMYLLLTPKEVDGQSFHLKLSLLTYHMCVSIFGRGLIFIGHILKYRLEITGVLIILFWSIYFYPERLLLV